MSLIGLHTYAKSLVYYLIVHNLDLLKQIVDPNMVLIFFGNAYICVCYRKSDANILVFKSDRIHKFLQSQSQSNTCNLLNESAMHSYNCYFYLGEKKPVLIKYLVYVIG